VSSYLRPTALGDALAELHTKPRTILAGGTDIYPARVGRYVDDDILDVSGLPDLRAISIDDGDVRIPALATWTDVVRADLPPGFDGLKAAARAIGGVQIQNRATVVGNVCNASPAADGVPNLIALDALLELQSVSGRRAVPVGEFVVGNRRTDLRDDELVTAIRVPLRLVPLATDEADATDASAAADAPGDASAAPADPTGTGAPAGSGEPRRPAGYGEPRRPAGYGEPRRPAGSRSTFLKLGSRAYLVISIAMVAVVIEVGPDGRIETARVVVGACSEVARRIPRVEARLVGHPAVVDRSAVAELADAITAADMARELAPIDDVRGTAAYRLDAAHVLVRRAITEVLA
jgi:CO/xanthine dehydrogenase FAD-binding subunit